MVLMKIDSRLNGMQPYYGTMYTNTYTDLLIYTLLILIKHVKSDKKLFDLRSGAFLKTPAAQSPFFLYSYLI